MSSRHGTTLPSDSRYARYRSPPRGVERRTPPPNGDDPTSSRMSDPSYRSNDAYNTRRDPPREPPRGPKALVDGPRGSFAPRGRGYRGRGDGPDRDFREVRDDPPYGRRGRGQDWAPRDRFDGRDLRHSPSGRDRSRSPGARGFRDTWDGPSMPSSSVSDYSYRGRGGYRGRARGDWDYGSRRTANDMDDREPYKVRSISNEQDRNRPMREERDLDSGRRDDLFHKESDDRDDRSRAHTGYRPDSRNSVGPMTSRSTSATSVQMYATDRSQKSFRENRERAMDTDRRHGGSEPALGLNDHQQRSDNPPLRRGELDRWGSRHNSPPPQAPPVPAFGSLPQVATTKIPDVSEKPAPRKADTPTIHPSRLGLLDHPKDAPSAPRAHTSINAPTAPKAQQQNRDIALDIREPPRGPTNSGERHQRNAMNTPIRPAQASGNDPSYSWPRRIENGLSPKNEQSASGTTETSPSVKKAVEEQGRNGIAPSGTEDVSPLATMKGIPTGPKADRGPPSLRQAPPSIRASQGRAPPTVPRGGGLGRGQGNAVWLNPNRKPGWSPSQPVIRDQVHEQSRSGIDGDIREQEGIDRRRSHTNANDHSAEFRQAGAQTPPQEVSEQRPGGNGLEDSKMNDHMEKTNSLTDDAGRDEDSDDGLDNAEIDENDYAEDERKFELKMQALEARRPPSPRSNPTLLGLLEELDALAIALEEKIQDGSADENIKVESAALGLPSPRVEAEDTPDSIGEDNRTYLPLRMRMQTPPIESLPFLTTGPPTPFSDIISLQDEPEMFDQVKTILTEQIQQQQRDLLAEYGSIHKKFRKDYRAWREQVEDEEEVKRAREEEVASSPPPELAEPSAQSTPSLSRRGRGIVSEYDYQRLLKASEESAAREERQRREREDRVYIPPDTFNDQREALVPNMLDAYEAESRLYADKTFFVPTHDALAALAFVPPEDSFTADEHEAFLYHYVQVPKKFGEIAKHIPTRTYQECVQHYYATKGRVSYKNHEINFWKTKKGKQMARKRTPGGGILIRSAVYDGSMGPEAQAVALTEKGRPRRAAAPTFGEVGEAEQPSAAVTPGRRTTVGKESMPASAEKPKRRGLVSSVRQKPGRKPNIAPLLAAAPATPVALSPQKTEPAVVQPQDVHTPPSAPARVEDVDVTTMVAQVLANFNKPKVTQTVAPAPTQRISAELLQPRPVEIPQPRAPSEGFRQETAPPMMLAQQGDSTAPINSYWNVSETQDLKNYIAFFGQDWNQIAERIPAKTMTMVKNRYNKLVKEGDKALELACDAATLSRVRGDDMGAEPAPTPVSTKRRYDSSQRGGDGHRALAPLIERSDSDRDSSSIRPKTSQTPVPAATPVPQKVSASVHAEQGAAALSSQMLSQGPGSPASHIDLQIQQQKPSLLHGSRLDRRLQIDAIYDKYREQGPQAKFYSSPQDASTSKQQRRRQEDRDMQIPRQQPATPEQNEISHAKSRNNEKPDRVPGPLDPMQGVSVSRERPSRQYESPIFDHTARGTIQVDDDSRGVIEKRQQQQKRQFELQQEAEFQRQQQQQQHHHQQQHQQQQDHQQHQQQILRQQHQQRQVMADNQAAGGYRGVGSSHLEPRFSSHAPSLSTTGPLTPMSPPSQSLLRPSSVPASAPTQQPAAPAQPKKSSIMSLLNDEPSEAKPSTKKPVGDGRVPTPPPVSRQTLQYGPPATGQSIDQMLHRRETLAEPAQYGQTHSRGISEQRSQHVNPSQKPAREPGRDWQSELRRTNVYEHRASSFQPPISQQQPKPAPSFATPTARYQALQQREHAASPPPSHSRTSSLTSLHPQVRHRPSGSAPSAEHSLRPSPYATLNPNQPSHQHHNAPQHQHHSSHEPSRTTSVTHIHHPYRSLAQQEAALMQLARQDPTNEHESLVRLHQQAAAAAQQKQQQQQQQQQPAPSPALHRDRFDIHAQQRRSSENIHALIPDLQRQQTEALRQQDEQLSAERRMVEEQNRREQEAQVQMRRLQEREGPPAAPTPAAPRSGGRFTPFYNEQGGYAPPPPAPIRDLRQGEGRNSVSGSAASQGRGHTERR